MITRVLRLLRLYAFYALKGNQMRTYLFDCPLCRHWYSVASPLAQQQCRKRGHCDTCATTNLYRFHCHVAFLEDSIQNADGTPGGRLQQLAQKYPDRVDVYRELYRKREMQLAAAIELGALFGPGNDINIEARRSAHRRQRPEKRLASIERKRLRLFDQAVERSI
jgi:hypothetical protein